MTPLQSWALLVLVVIAILAALTLLPAIDRRIDRVTAAVRSMRRTAPAPTPARPTEPVRFHEGYPVPASGELYDHAVHGI